MLLSTIGFVLWTLRVQLLQFLHIRARVARKVKFRRVLDCVHRPYNDPYGGEEVRER